MRIQRGNDTREAIDPPVDVEDRGLGSPLESAAPQLSSGTGASPRSEGAAPDAARPEPVPPRADLEALQYSHSGKRYVLGYGRDFYGIWDRQSPGPPVERFPRTDDGWEKAWARYSGLEPDAEAVGLGGSSHPPAAVFATQRRPTSPMAVASLVLGIAGFVLYAIPSILALVFGYRAKRRIDRSGGAQGGRGLAVAGITLGWVGIAFWILMIVLVWMALSSLSSCAGQCM